MHTFGGSLKYIMSKKFAATKKKKPSARKKKGRISGLTKDLLLNNLSSPIFVCHHVHKRFLYVNQDFAEMIGSTVKECYKDRAKTFLKLIEPGDNHLLRT